MSSDSLNEVLRSHLECPVCFETCGRGSTPIYMCSNGHIVCENCQALLKECSECRTPGKPTLRCVKLEKIAELVKLPCANEPQGCKLFFSMGDLAEHLPKCDHGFKCLICLLWKGSAPDLLHHVITTHERGIEFPFHGSVTRSTGLGKKAWQKTYYSLLYGFENAIFWLESKHNYKTRIYSRAVRIVSHDPKDASQFYYSMEYKSNNETSKCKILCQGDVTEEDATTGFMEIVVPDCLIDSYSDGVFEYTLTLQRKN